jgi:hypothetical protein
MTEGLWAIRKAPEETNIINVNSIFFICINIISDYYLNSKGAVLARYNLVFIHVWPPVDMRVL